LAQPLAGRRRSSSSTIWRAKGPPHFFRESTGVAGHQQEETTSVVLSFRRKKRKNIWILRVVLEEVTNTHNASAVVRPYDAAGVFNLDIISLSPEPLLINKAVYPFSLSGNNPL